MKTTYVLFVPGTRGPTVYHDNIKTAREEAKRLLESGGASEVMVCRFVEGLRKKTITEPMEANPLRPRQKPFDDSDCPF